jgi:fatty-acyl-CoA synthase
MVVSGGENVFPGEAEDVIRAHPGVADVAVLGVEDVEFGQRLRAFVVKKANVDVSSEEMKSHVRTRLERYKVPPDFVFVDELPRNPTGKLLRGRLETLSGGGR